MRFWASSLQNNTLFTYKHISDRGPELARQCFHAWYLMDYLNSKNTTNEVPQVCFGIWRANIVSFTEYVACWIINNKRHLYCYRIIHAMVVAQTSSSLSSSMCYHLTSQRISRLQKHLMLILYSFYLNPTFFYIYTLRCFRASAWLPCVFSAQEAALIQKLLERPSESKHMTRHNWIPACLDRTLNVGYKITARQQANFQRYSCEAPALLWRYTTFL